MVSEFLFYTASAIIIIGVHSETVVCINNVKKYGITYLVRRQRVETAVITEILRVAVGFFN